MVAFQRRHDGPARSPRRPNELFAKDAYRDYLELHGLSVQLTEALAEYWHARVRAELGFGGEDAARPRRASCARATAGSRYSFGYPACPDLEDQAKLVELLRPERIGVELSEEFQLHPEQSTSAHRRPPPRGQVLQRPMSDSPQYDAQRGRPRRARARVLFDMDGLLVDTEHLVVRR